MIRTEPLDDALTRRRLLRVRQELLTRAAVAATIWGLDLVLALGHGAAPRRAIGALALAGLLLNGPYYLAALTGWQLRLQAYGRLLVDVILITIGVYVAGGLAAGAYVGVYALVAVYAGIVFSSEACLLATAVSTVSFLVVALAQQVGWLAWQPGVPGDEWTVAVFNLAVLNIAGGMTAFLSAAYRRTRAVATAMRATGEQLRVAAETSEQRIEHLVQSLGAIVWEADAATLRFTFVSRAAETLLGYPVERWRRDPEFLPARVHDEDRAEVMRLRAAAAGGQGYACEYRLVAADGRMVWVRDTVRVVRDAAGRPQYLSGVMVDVGERKQLEAQLLQSQKMEAIGRLAGGVAHDFNNLLTVILGHTNLLRRRPALEGSMRRALDLVEQTAERASALTRQLLAFSRRQMLQPEIIDLNAVVRGMEPMLRLLIGEDITLALELALDPGAVRADPGQIEQVVMNLVVNARDAMPAGGLLVIATQNRHVSAPTPGLAPGRFVTLSVTDTGSGMDRETQAHIFEPFFTTKEAGKGTGLGLATVYGIVTQSGGQIDVASQVGQGTRFTIYLPSLEGAAPVRAAAAPAPVPAIGATVLLVEDEEAVRAVTREMLEASGCAVLEAGDGAAALGLSARHADPIDLLLTDVVMPRMSGRELADRLAAARPGLKVLFMSGYTDEAILRHRISDSGYAFIQKPFRPQDLARKVREVLDGAPPSG